MRQLKGRCDRSLVVAPRLIGWEFSSEPVVSGSNNSRYLWKSILKLTLTTVEAVPVLWDKETATIVINESCEIIRMFDTVRCHR